MAAAATVNQALWIRKILSDLHMKQLEATLVFVDNQGIILISNNLFSIGKLSISTSGSSL